VRLLKYNTQKWFHSHIITRRFGTVPVTFKQPNCECAFVRTLLYNTIHTASNTITDTMQLLLVTGRYVDISKAGQNVKPSTALAINQSTDDR